MIRLTKRQVLELHTHLLEEFHGTNGIRDEFLLDSALQAPFQTFGNQDLFPTVEAKAARLGYGIIKNHAMFDGNKRLGVHVMLVFLELNNIKVRYAQKELYEEIINIASGYLSCDDLLDWIYKHQ